MQMRSMAMWLAITVMSLFLLACLGPRTMDGECRDYQPLEDYCDDSAEYVCQITEDGCKQCSCISSRDAHQFR